MPSQPQNGFGTPQNCTGRHSPFGAAQPGANSHSVFGAVQSAFDRQPHAVSRAYGASGPLHGPMCVVPSQAQNGLIPSQSTSASQTPVVPQPGA